MQIQWAHLDLLGHVNNISIVGYFQAARIHFVENIGFAPKPGMHYGPIEAATAIQFSKQLHYPGNITVLTTVEKIGNTSFTLLHKIIDSAGDIAAYGTEVLVYFDFFRQCKLPIPEELKDKIRDFLEEK